MFQSSQTHACRDVIIHRLFRENESGNTMKGLLGHSSLEWETRKTQGVFEGQSVFDAGGDERASKKDAAVDVAAAAMQFCPYQVVSFSKTGGRASEPIHAVTRPRRWAKKSYIRTEVVTANTSPWFRSDHV